MAWVRVRMPVLGVLMLGLLTPGCGEGVDGSREALGRPFEPEDRLSRLELNEVVRRTVESGAFQITSTVRSIDQEPGSPETSPAKRRLVLRFAGIFDPKTHRGSGIVRQTRGRGVGQTSVVLDGVITYQRTARGWGRAKGIYELTGVPQVDELPADPALAVQFLRGAEGPIRRTGTEELHGVPTTRYALNIDFAFIERWVPRRIKRSVRRTVEQTFADMPNTLQPATVWIGRDGVVRRMDWGYSTSDSCVRTRRRARVELWDFGVPFKAAIPTDPLEISGGSIEATC